MAKDRLRIIRTVPGAARLAPIVTAFCGSDEGIVTAFSDACLPVVRGLMPADGRVHILPFGEVITWSLGLCGLPALPLAQRGLVESAVMDACLALPPDSPLYGSAPFRGLHRRVASCLSVLGSWQVGPDDLEAMAVGLDPVLGAKLRSLAAVARTLREVLEQLGRTTNDDQIRRCLDAPPPPDARFGRILLLAGSNYAPNDVAWVRWAVSCGAEITVVTEGHAGSSQLFHGAGVIETQLGVAAEVQPTTDPLALNLFAVGSATGTDLKVTIQSAADPLAEAEWAVRGCLADLRAGIPNHRIGVFARDLQAYAPLLAAASARLGVPLRVSRRGPLLGNGFARLVLASMKLCASDDVRDLLPILRSTYIALPRAVSSALASHIREACRDPEGQWRTLEVAAANPEAPVAWLSALLDWRTEALAEERDLPAWKGRLDKLVLEVFAEAATSDTKRADVAGRDVVAQNVMRRSIAQHAGVQRVRSNPRLNLAGFVALCEKLWAAEEIGVPQSDGGIGVFRSGDAIEDVDSLYVLGMLEGMFPRRRAEDPILNDADLAAISACLPDRPPLPTSHDRARAERDEFYRVCTSASSKLVFSYPLTEEDRDNVPAFYLAEIDRALGGTVLRRNLPRGKLTPDLPDCLAPRDLALAEACQAEPLEPPLNELQTDVARHAVQGPEGAAMTPGQIRDILECPFRFVARHRLKLETGRSGNRWGLLSRLPQAVGLWSVGDKAQAIEVLEKALEAEIDAHYGETTAWERTLLRLGGARVIDEWVEREFAARDTWPREPGSVKVNARFGEPPLSADLPTMGGGRVRLEGVVPAVSRVGEYWVAHSSQVRRPSQPRGGLLEEDSDVLQIGIPMMALFDRRGGVAVEVESMRGGRTLYTLYQGDDPPPLVADTRAGLNVARLGKPSEFMPAVKRMLADALMRIDRVAVEAGPGEYCAWCDLGELCRRSSEFGEDDSPFGEDEN